MHKHHVIPRHEWKVRFGNLDGFNAPDNVVSLTVEQHSQAHLLLFELNHSEYDLIASQTLSGQIGKEEATRRAVSFANTGNRYTIGLKRSEEQKQRHSEFMKNSTPWNKGTSNLYSGVYIEKLRMASTGHTHNRGRKHSEKSCVNMSNAHKGKTHSPETKEKMRISRLSYLNMKKAV